MSPSFGMGWFQAHWLVIRAGGPAKAWLSAILQDNRKQGQLLAHAGVSARKVDVTRLDISSEVLVHWVPLLVRAGASLEGNSHRRIYHTLLGRAAQAGDVALVRVLLATGADPNRSSQTGQTPLDTCISFWPSSAPADGHRETALLLMAYGARTTGRSTINAPLDEKVLESLLKTGAKPAVETVLRACRLCRGSHLTHWLTVFDRLGMGADSSLWKKVPLAWHLVSGVTHETPVGVLAALVTQGHPVGGKDGHGRTLLHAWCLSLSSQSLEWGKALLGMDEVLSLVEEPNASGKTVRIILEDAIAKLEQSGEGAGVQRGNLALVRAALKNNLLDSRLEDVIETVEKKRL